MGTKSKSAHKKKKISKHVLKAREEQTMNTESANTDTKANAETPEVVKRRPKKNRHVKDTSEAATYLQGWKENQSGKSGWKFNKNTQSWLIRHMYEADKIPKGIFALLQEYLSGIEGKATKSWIRSEASRRALRYKNYEKMTRTKGGENEDTKPDSTAKTENKSTAGLTQSEDDRVDEARWNNLSDHDKRKEYKRARQILETISE